MLYLCDADKDYSKYALKDTKSGEVCWYSEDQISSMHRSGERILGAVDIRDGSPHHHPYLGARSPLYWVACYTNGKYIICNNSSKVWKAKEDLITEEELITLANEGCEIYGVIKVKGKFDIKPHGNTLVDVCRNWQAEHTLRCKALGKIPDIVDFRVTDDEVMLTAWFAQSGSRAIHIPRFVTGVICSHLITSTDTDNAVKVIIPRSCDTIVNRWDETARQSTSRGIQSIHIEDGQRALNIKELRIISSVLNSVHIPKRVEHIGRINFSASENLKEFSLSGSLSKVDCEFLALPYVEKLSIDGSGLDLSDTGFVYVDRLRELNLGRGVKAADLKYLGVSRGVSVRVQAHRATILTNVGKNILLERY